MRSLALWLAVALSAAWGLPWWQVAILGCLFVCCGWGLGFAHGVKAMVQHLLRVRP